MSDYGPPHRPPPGAPGFDTAPGSSAPDPASGTGQQVAILTYAAAGLGVLGFIWGFLDWLSTDDGTGGSTGATGFEFLGATSVGLLLVAGLLAGASTLEKKAITLAPAAVSVAALLVTFGVLVNHGDYDAGIGLILAFITAILQAAALIVAWLMTNDRMPAFGGGSSPAAPYNQWQQGPGPQGTPGQFGGFAGDQGPSQYGPPPGYGSPSGPPSGYGSPSPRDQAPSYGPPAQDQSPSYGPPSGYGPPQQPPPSGPPPSPPSKEDDASRTQVLPRFAPDQNFGPDQNSTQQGIPIFDPQSRPERSGEQEPPSYGR